MSNEKQRSQMGRAMGFLILFLGVIITPIGVVGLQHFSWDYVGLLILALALSGILLLIGGISLINTAREQQKKHKTIQAEVNKIKAYKGELTTLNERPVLGMWDIDEQTWNAFHKNEIRYRNEDNIYFFIAFLIIGTISIMLLRESTFGIAFGITAGLGIIIVILRRTFALSKLTVTTSNKRVVITDYLVVLNNQEYVLFSDDRQARKIKLIKQSTPVILEYTIYWPTRSGETFDELRIPVPPNAVEIAENIVQQFNAKHTYTKQPK